MCTALKSDVKWRVYRASENYRLDDLDQKISTSKSNIDELRVLRDQYKESLDKIYTEKAVGAQIRARSQWVEEGKQNTAYFLNLEKCNQKRNCIDSVNYDNQEARSDESILKSCNMFYSRLYSSQDIKDIDKYLNQYNITKVLSTKQQKMCEGKITTDECDKALLKLKRN